MCGITQGAGAPTTTARKSQPVNFQAENSGGEGTQPHVLRMKGLLKVFTERWHSSKVDILHVAKLSHRGREM